MLYVATIDGREFDIEISAGGLVRMNGKEIRVDFEAINGQPVYTLLADGKSYEAYVYPENENWQVILMGRLYSIKVEDERDQMLRKAGIGKTSSSPEFLLKAPMPGLVIDVPVSDGVHVEKGDVLVILESMKMQNELKSPYTGKVSRVNVKAGDHVEQHQVLLRVV